MNTELINTRLRPEAEGETGARLTTVPATISANDLAAEDYLRQFDIYVAIMREQLAGFLEQCRLRLDRARPLDVLRRLSDAVLEEPY